MLRYFLWGLLLAAALPPTARAQPHRILIEDDDLIEGESPLALPALPLPALEVPPPQPLPEAILAPTLKLTDAHGKLDALEEFRQELLRAPGREAISTSIARLADSHGLQLDARLYRRALRGGPQAIDETIDAEAAPIRQQRDDAVAARDTAMQSRLSEPDADVWRLLRRADSLADNPDALRAIAQELVERYPEGPHQDRILFLHGHTTGEAAVLRQVVADAPDSALVPHAHLSLARHALQSNAPDAALRHLGLVDAPPEPLRVHAAVLSASAQMVVGRDEDALKILLPVRGDVQEPTSAVFSEHLARAIRHVADLREQAPLLLLRELSLPSHEAVALARELEQAQREDDAIAVYEHVLATWPALPEAPVHQARIAALHIARPVPDLERHASALQKLVEDYGEEGYWWTANSTQPEALEQAQALRARALLTAAQDSHSRAQLSGEPADYFRASTRYRQLLETSPEDAQLLWFYADTLVGSGQHPEAIEALDALADADHSYAAAARLRQVNVLHRQLLATHDTLTERPEGVTATQREPLPSGAERPVYAIGAEHASLIEAIDALLDAPAPPEDIQTVAGYTDAIETSKPGLVYAAGAIFLSHGHLEAARERFVLLIDTWPSAEEAQHAASGILRSFQEEEDLENLRAWALRFAMTDLGDTTPYAKQAVQASFMLAQQATEHARELDQAGDAAGAQAAFRAASARFVTFTQEHPNDELTRMALYNAGYALEQAGDAQKASTLFERYTLMYPDDERAWPLMFRIASHHTAVLELERAVRVYEQLVHSAGPSYPDTATALYNTGALLGLLGEHRAAAEQFEVYAAMFPELEDAAHVMFGAGAHWEQVDARAAVAFYTRYLERHATEITDQTIAAHHRLYVLAPDEAQRGRAREALLSAHARLAPQASSRSSRLAAEVALPPLLEAAAEAQDPKALAVWDARSGDHIRQHPDFESTAAIIYTGGAVLLDMAEQATDPAQAAALREAGRSRLEQLLAQAAATRRWSPWMDRAEARLGRPTLPLRSMGDTTQPATTDPMPRAQEQLRQDAHAVAPYADIGEHLLAQGEPEQARRIAQHALFTIPDAQDAALWAVVGWSHWEGGERDEAQHALENAVGQEPAHPLARHRLARVRMYHHDWAAGLALLDDLASLTPAQELDRGICLHRLGQLEDAEAAYQQAASGAPGAAQPHHNLAVLYESQGRTADAEAARAAAAQRR